MKERWIAGGKIAGEPSPVALRIVEGRIAGRAAHAPAGAEVLDASGHWLCPMVIDAHVHLAFAAGLREPATGDSDSALRKIAGQMLRGGVCAALDLGAPKSLLPGLGALSPLRVVTAGPLLCAPGGYPTRSWGEGGFGLELRTPAEAHEAVAMLAGLGARMVKLSFDGRFPVLDAAVARAAADEGHKRGLLACAHALDVAGVQAALAAGVDVLAHTPTAALPDQLVGQIGKRGLVLLSTLHAFEGTPVLLANVARLRAAGARLVYGTDLGNQGTSPGVLQAELSLLSRAGLRADEIVRAATTGAARLLGQSDLGTLDSGAAAHLLVLAEDPHRDATALARPAFVVVAGERLPPA